MEKSCEEFGDGALEERKKLRQVNGDFKTLALGVHRAITVIPRKPVPSRAQSQHSKRAPPPKTPNPLDVVVRPAPYPIKNYMFPAKKLVGPRRYFCSRANQALREDEFELQHEIAQFPVTIGPDPTPEGISLTITPALSLIEVPSSWSSTHDED